MRWSDTEAYSGRVISNWQELDCYRFSVQYDTDPKPIEHYVKGNNDRDILRVCVLPPKDEVLKLACKISGVRLTSPAKGKACMHLSCCNFDELTQYVRSHNACPVQGCSFSGQMRGTKSIERDDDLAQRLKDVPHSVSEVIVCGDGSIKLKPQVQGPVVDLTGGAVSTAAVSTAAAEVTVAEAAAPSAVSSGMEMPPQPQPQPPQSPPQPPVPATVQGLVVGALVQIQQVRRKDLCGRQGRISRAEMATTEWEFEVRLPAQPLGGLKRVHLTQLKARHLVLRQDPAVSPASALAAAAANVEEAPADGAGAAAKSPSAAISPSNGASTSSEAGNEDRVAGEPGVETDERVQAPIWWVHATDDIKLAEFLYMNQVQTKEDMIDRLFKTDPFEQAFGAQLPLMEDRFAVVPFFYATIKTPDSSVMSHLRRLRRDGVPLQHLSTSAGRAKRVRSADGRSTSHESKKTWVRSDGEPIYTDLSGHVLPSQGHC